MNNQEINDKLLGPHALIFGFVERNDGHIGTVGELNMGDGEGMTKEELRDYMHKEVDRWLDECYHEFDWRLMLLND